MAPQLTTGGSAVGGKWRRRVGAFLMASLRDGMAPARLSATMAVGVVCALFPLLGATTAVTLFAGLALRMNQPLLHTINQLLAPVQLAMILVYVRAGEWMWQSGGDHFTVSDVVRTFHEGSLMSFLHRFGWAGIHAVTAWAVTAPLVALACYMGARGPIRRLASLRTAR